MAPSRAEPLSVLNSTLAEVLVQTGKALKVSARDDQGSVSGASGAIRHRSQEALRAYHFALDELEGEILQAKAALLRDLAKLQAARAPPPSLTPPPEPQRAPAQQVKHEPATAVAVMEAPMLELPSTAAHTIAHQPFAMEPASNPVAPFPDMGSDMSSGILTLTDKGTKSAQRLPTAAVQSSSVATPPLKSEAAVSPNTVVGTQLAADNTAHPTSLPTNSKAAVAANGDVQVPHLLDISADGTVGGHGGSNDAPEFTNMQFSLDTSAAGLQNAPPAPMPAFDMASFATNEPPGDFSNEVNFEPMGNEIGMNIPTTMTKESQNETRNLEDVFDLDGGADSMDLDLDLGNGTVNDSTFDDLFLDTGDNTGMGQFDNAFFGLD
ncbi:uncharacterized protein B0I36DRAFT_358210 [Microdochium trichocladiopsis]|uniref:Uncharacterized protein n=1 Tax=Microdochium trichocladiopsis TaxID=1682393 RepID=A0A9P9BWW5_9PEZI|nr:uncharacterized protein B0I36DRAFT_358210 [Microdochium trichocladiopsis]KAH7040995.1 hypothetical protein B0I36DRAFT_358210 [Microdochium trichocladiopsis]